MSKSARKFAPLAFGVAALSPVLSHAALDTAITSAITGAQTDLLALFGALTAAGVAIWVGRIVYNHFKVR